MSAAMPVTRKRLLIAVLIFAGAIYLQVSNGIDDLFGVGLCSGPLCNMFGVLLALVMGAVCLIAALFAGVFWLETRRWSVRPTVIAVYSGLMALSTAIGVPIAVRLDHAEDERLAQNSQPIIKAIERFESDRGYPPERLEAVVPAYLPAVPSTGLFHYPKFEIQVCGIDDSGCFGDRWRLSVAANPGRIFEYGCNRYAFAPSQQYPAHDEDELCHSRPVGSGWIYEYGD